MPRLGADELTALSALLRARPASVAELAQQVSLPSDLLGAALAGLSALGFVELDGERIEIVAPEAVTVAVASAALAEQRERLAELDGFLATLPMLSSDWRMGEQPTGSVPVELVHGIPNGWNLWMRLMAQSPPRAPITVFPDFGGLATIVIENRDALREAKQRLGFSLRAITVPEALAEPAEREQVARFAEIGVEVRTLAVVPGWFYVDAGVLGALPLTWGEAVPSSIAIVREPAVLAPLASYIEDLWERSNPIPGVTDGWDSVLGLLAQGLSDGAIASALGQSVRTVRRRIADAAEAHGAASRFALGVEWERSRRS